MKTVKAGHVYVINNGRKVKIGISKNIDKRLRTLQAQGGFKITEQYITPINGNYDKCEQMAHSLLAEHREIGEWFNIPFPEAVKVVKRLHQETFCVPIETDMGNGAKIIVEAFEDASLKNEILDLINVFGWTEQGKAFVLSLPFYIIKKIINLACECPAISIVNGDRIHIIYPYGYEEHDKNQYILHYDKIAIANDLGCSVEDAPDWDDFCLDITDEKSA